MTMQRNFTMRRSCRFCLTGFTIASSNHWFCGYADCTRRRRKEDRAALKASRVTVPERHESRLEPSIPSGV
jgi:hypothetical protein